MLIAKSTFFGSNYFEHGRRVAFSYAKSWQLRIPPETYICSHVDSHLVKDLYYPKEIAKIQCLKKLRQQEIQSEELCEDGDEMIDVESDNARFVWELIAHSEHLDDNINGVIVCNGIIYRIKRSRRVLWNNVTVETLENKQPVATITEKILHRYADFHKDLPIFDKVVITKMSYATWTCIDDTEKWHKKKSVKLNT